MSNHPNLLTTHQPLPPWTAHPTAYQAPHPPMTVQQLPPGVQVVTLPDGTRTLAYAQPPTTPAPPVVQQPIPTWAKTTALLAPTVGGGITAAGIGLSYVAPGLTAMSHLLWPVVALIGICPIAAAALLRAARSRTDNEPTTPPHITNITATGMFGRANGTINHR